MSAPHVPTVEPVDPLEDAALAEWFAVETASVHHGRPFALQRSLAALTSAVQHPSAYYRRVLLAARRGADVVGVAELTLSTADNPHLAELEIHVHPDHRRRGVGRALHDAADAVRREDGRTTVIGELYVPVGDGADAGALDFAAATGFTSAHEESHLAMRLPADPERVAALSRALPGWELLTWRATCPAELRASYVAMRNQMNADVPTGDVDAAPAVFDEERLASEEERLGRSYDTVVAVARRASDGVLGGYSRVFLDRSSDAALQDDTFVMSAHRGHGLGMQLKLATLAVVTAEHPERTAIHTWTDPDNTAMIRTNAAFGYEVVEVMHEMQRVD